jgi:hypothetical protein
MPMERGEAMVVPGRAAALLPGRGIHHRTRSGSPAPSPPSQRERSVAMEGAAQCVRAWAEPWRGNPGAGGAAGELQLEPHTSRVRCRCGVSCAAAMPLTTVDRPGRDLVRSCLSGCAASRRQKGDEPPWLNRPRCRQSSPAGRRGR